jgi:hypothetical protein
MDEVVHIDGQAGRRAEGALRAGGNASQPSLTLKVPQILLARSRDTAGCGMACCQVV